jgi:hypothetical protein
VLGFLGMTDIEFVYAEGLAMGEDSTTRLRRSAGADRRAGGLSDHCGRAATAPEPQAGRGDRHDRIIDHTSPKRAAWASVVGQATSTVRAC